MAPPEQTPHRPPTDLDYETVRIIGKGAYGEVWLVRDKAGQYRACKVVYRESFRHERPYEREFEGIRKFEPVSQASPSQVKILYVGRRDAAGYFFYIMELADDAAGTQTVHPEGYVPKTLKSELERRGRLPAAECVQIGLSLCAALENLHEHGLIHRDVKPANIIFVKGLPKLADIGLVTDADVTVSYVGTDGFIPPEGPGSAAADAYALGKVLYEISTGNDRLEYPELPMDFGHWSDHAALLELNAVVARACEAQTQKRYASAGRMRADLMLLQDGKSVRQIRASQKRQALAGKIAAGAGLALLLALGAIHLSTSRNSPERSPLKAPLTPLPLPHAVQADQAEAQLREEYRETLATGTGAGRQQAAFELLTLSQAEKDPARQLASLRLAAFLAAQAENYSLALQICDRMAERFRMSALPAKALLLAEAGRHQPLPPKTVELAGLCIRTGFEALGADDYDSGTNLAALAKETAQNSGEARLVQEAGFLDHEMSRCREGFEPVRQSEVILSAQPASPAAGLAVGKFLCFVKNDWKAGLPLMARTTEERLKPVLVAELTHEAKSVDESVELANLWGNLAKASVGPDQTNYFGRARYWSMRAIVATKEPAKSSLRAELDHWLQAAPTEPAEIHIYSRVAGTETIDIYSDRILWKSGRGAINSRINEAILGDLKAGDLKVVENCGATRVLPESVDFLSAHLSVNRKPRRQGQARLEPRSDHVRVILAHPRTGYAEIEVTVAFGHPQ